MRDRGEGGLSYVAVILLIAAVAAAVTVVAVPEKVTGGVAAAVCRVSGDKDCARSGGGSSMTPTPGATGPSGSPGTGGPTGSPGPSGRPTTPGGGAPGTGEESPELREYREANAAANDAEGDAARAQADWDNFDLLKELLALGLDFLIGDIKECLSKPSLGNCIWALLSIIPWGKIGKFLKSVPKLIKLADRFLQLRRDLDRLLDARRAAKARRADALDALKKKIRACPMRSVPVIPNGAGRHRIRYRTAAHAAGVRYEPAYRAMPVLREDDEVCDAAWQGALHIQDEIARGNANHKIPGLNNDDIDEVSKYLDDIMKAPGQKLADGSEVWFDASRGYFILKKNDYSATGRQMTRQEYLDFIAKHS